ncbi:hypothetical protein BAU15_02695 [Enterococcus sp. JM4C]|uniref:helix-turn-helix domain-containing protein n=1 Tax=Candidatus Enterococcus huntleyi TaxID=1857217 RepID=UPI001379FF61|nr:helix-turn-helix transcriptional regulator [Enterococcus sp. JM4C]KAF1299652.1 hypothetical protein BAU15_02695 [Enterococcus sp. JM4C]
MLAIGTQIKKVRTKNQMTQKELAEVLKTTPQTISEWENNMSTPPVEALIDLSRHFKLSVDELLGNQQTAFFDSLLSKKQERKELIKKFGHQLPDILPDQFNQKDQ